MKKKLTKTLGFKVVLTVIVAVLIAISFYAIFSYIAFDKIENWKTLNINGFQIWPVLIIFVILALSIIIGCVLSLLLLKGFYSPVNELKKALLNVSKGVFNKLEIPKNTDEEVYDLFKVYNKMINDLNQMEGMSKDFVANVSHEFKNPLATINGFATLLKDENISADERKTYINFISQATENLTNLTTNILAISKIENLEIIKKTEFNLAEQIRQITLMFNEKVAEKNLELDVNLDEVMINSNRDLTQSIFQNLISNAIKFTDSGLIQIWLRDKGGCVIFAVKDSGVGMSEETAKNIFTKFYQGETSHQTQGNGLGLALVKEIVKKLDGEIEVRSELGKGTLFAVKLNK